MPITSWPCSFRSAAAAEESTPPLMATTTRVFTAYPQPPAAPCPTVDTGDPGAASREIILEHLGLAGEQGSFRVAPPQRGRFQGKPVDISVENPHGRGPLAQSRRRASRPSLVLSSGRARTRSSRKRDASPTWGDGPTP